MLSKKDIEELATGAVKRYFNTCNLVSPQIQENDKTPDWDGELNLYENKKDIRKNYIGSLRIQVKGKEVPKFKDKETFPVETVFLKNARNEGFVFFVVEVMTDGKSKIFYKKMAPIEIRGELASIEQQQKTKNIQFEPLSMDKPWIEVELKAFLLDCIKQKSFASTGQVCIEDIKNIYNYQWEFTFQGKKDNLLNDFLGGFKSFLYLKTKEGVEIPIGNGLMNIVMPELTIKKDENVYIGKDIVASNYILTYTFQGKKDNLLNDFLGGFKSFLYLKTKEGVEIPIGNGLMNIVMPELTIKKDENVYIGKDIVASNYILTYTKENVSYKLEGLFLLKSEQGLSSTERSSKLEILANTTDGQIKAYEVYKRLIKFGSIKFGETEITIKASNKKVILSMINKRLSNLSIHKSVLNILNIKTPINYKTFTEEDDFSMRQLYKALIEHKAIGLTNPQDIFKIRIANINVLLVCQSDNNKKFYLDNAFASPLIKVMQNSDVSPFQVPIFSFLGQKGYVLFDNIPYNRIIEIYNECNLKDSRVIIQANLDLLQILKAYDELKQLGHLEKSKHTIKAAQSLSKWLLENERENSMIALHQLNSLQITKRQRAFTEDEINLLLQLSQNNSDMVRAGAFLLLGKIDVAQFIIQQFPEDEKTRFMEFPIAIFIKGTNC